MPSVSDIEQMVKAVFDGNAALAAAGWTPLFSGRVAKQLAFPYSEMWTISDNVLCRTSDAEIRTKLIQISLYHNSKDNAKAGADLAIAAFPIDQDLSSFGPPGTQELSCLHGNTLYMQDEDRVWHYAIQLTVQAKFPRNPTFPFS